MTASSIQFGAGTGTINFNHSSSNYVFSPQITGAGSGTVNVLAGATIFTADNAYSGATNISSGATLQLGNGGAAGSITGGVANNGALIFDRTGFFTYGGAITGGGEVAFLTGTTHLTGANAYTGATSVTGGQLFVDGSLGNTTVIVGSGAGLGGTGSIGGSVNVASGGALIGASGQTLTMGSLILNGGANVNATLGAPSANALFNVTGGLTLAGNLNVTGAVGFGPGLYALFQYGGILTNNGLAVGPLPGGDTGSVQTSVANEVNLVVSGPSNGGIPTTQFWNGVTASPTGTVVGGSGTWSAGAPTNWTDSAGSRSDPWNGNFAVFQGRRTAGSSAVVTIDDSAGAVTTTGMQFIGIGWTVQGGAIALNGAGGTTTIRVGDGSAAGIGDNATIASQLTGDGGLVKADLGTLILTGANSYLGGTTISGGTLQIGAGGTSGSIQGNVTNNAALSFDRSDNVTFAGAIGGTGALTQLGGGVLTLAGVNTYSGPTTVAAGTLRAGANGQGLSSFSPASAMTVNASATLDLGGLYQTVGSLAGAGTLTNSGASLAVLTTGGDNSSTLFSGLVKDGASATGLQKNGTGTFTLTGANSYSGGTWVLGGTLAIRNSNALGSGPLTLAGGTTLLLDGNGLVVRNYANLATALDPTFTVAAGNSDTYAGVIAGNGSLTLNGGGSLILSANNTYTGATTVAAGTLTVNGSIASSSLTTVDNGAALTGVGTVGSVSIASGGVLAPGAGAAGGALTVAGNLLLNPGATYQTQVNATSASLVNAASATLTGANVQAIYAPGSYLTKQYTILHTSGGLGGTSFAGLAGSSVPAGFTQSLSYTANDALLNLTANLGDPSGQSPLFGLLPRNPQNVANALNFYFNAGGALPPNFVRVFGTSGAGLSGTLSALSGEAATGAQQTAFRASSQFLSLMLDPFAPGRGGGGVPGGVSPLAFASDERPSLPANVALAYANVIKLAPPKTSTLVYEPHWSVWASSFGGYNKLGGDAYGAGSHDLSTSAFGVASGLDYHLTPQTFLGAALAGGGTNWGVAQGLGGGSGDFLQAGLYGGTGAGPAYLSAAFGFANHWLATQRTAVFGDALTGNFAAQNYSGRVETGWRLGPAFGGLAPYAAFQGQSFVMPGFWENDAMGGGFGLKYAGRTASELRGELGARWDYALPLGEAATLIWRSRAAFAHDWVSDPTLVASFELLPGANFTVTGATPVKNAALVATGAELRLLNNVMLAAKFDGEFSDRARSYAGTASLRYSW